MSLISDEFDSRSAAVNRWVRQGLLRENLFNALKTFAWLGPLTLVIWVYAERAQVTNYAAQTISIDVRSDRNRYIRLEIPPEKNVIATLSGPRSRVDELRQRLNPVTGDPTVIIPIDANLPPGQAYDFDTAERISLSSAFQNTGVSVSDSKPARIRIFVDQYIEREVDVRVPKGVTNLVGTPIFTPAKVTLRAPETIIARAEAALGGPLTYVEADLAAAKILDKPGPYEGNIRVISRQLPDANVTFSPDNIKATLEVRPSDASYMIPSMAVFVKMAQNLQKDYVAETTTNTITSVNVIGPREQIDMLQRDNMERAQAVLTVNIDALPAGTNHTGTLRIEFPPYAESVRISPNDPARTIEYKLVKRTAEQ